MSFKVLGTLADLQISVPQKRTTLWADQLESDAWLKIVNHNHTGNGTGRQLGSGSFENNAVTTAKIASSAVTSDKIADNAITSSKLEVGAVDTTALADAAVTELKIADNEVKGSKIRLNNDQWLRARNAANNADVNIIRVNSSNVVEFGADVAPGDNTVSTAKIQDNAVTNAKMADNSVGTAELVNLNVTTAKIANDAIGPTQVNPTLGQPNYFTFATNSSTGDLRRFSNFVLVSGNLTITVPQLSFITVINVSGSARTISVTNGTQTVSLGSLANNTSRGVFSNSTNIYALPAETITPGV